jgi:hypothetical protein
MYLRKLSAALVVLISLSTGAGSRSLAGNKVSELGSVISTVDDQTAVALTIYMATRDWFKISVR